MNAVIIFQGASTLATLFDHQVIGELIGSVVTILTLILTQRAAANRVKDDLEIQELKLATALAEHENRVATQFDEVTTRVDRNNSSIENVQEKLAENTDVSKKAFNEANHVNTKISQLQESLVNTQKDANDNLLLREQQNRIESTGVETHDHVLEIKEKMDMTGSEEASRVREQRNRIESTGQETHQHVLDIEGKVNIVKEVIPTVIGKDVKK